MRIYLASFMQPTNFGPGRVISITHGSKPRDIDVKAIFEPLTPPQTVIEEYNRLRVEEPKKASDYFVSTYKAQLEAFFEEISLSSKEENVSMTDLLPFQDGDTLCSWERSFNTNYRDLLAPVLEKIGYEVVLN